MMNGHEFNKKKLHNKGYFQELKDSLETDKNVLEILTLSRKQPERRVKWLRTVDKRGKAFVAS